MNELIFARKKTLNLKGRLVSIDRPKVMGILNATPDSFYDGGKYTQHEACIRRIESMMQEGVDIIDVGGYSSRPGADFVDEEVEINRVIPCIEEAIHRYPNAIVSIDTFRSEVAKAAVDHGALMINDISGGEADPKMFETVAALNVPYIMMHMKGNPQNMQQLAQYENLKEELFIYFQKKVKLLNNLGVYDVILDPGFGFAKTLDQNYELLGKLDYFNMLNVPILVGVSRKSMIYKQLKVTADDALNGTTALHTIALIQGASILRVHDVKEAKEVITLFQKTFK